MIADGLIQLTGKFAASITSTFGSVRRLSILIYHSIKRNGEAIFPGDVDEAQFEWQMQLLSRHFTPLTLNEAVRLLPTGKLPKRAVCVTFDDGYADNADVALPILQRFNFPATFFISVEYLNGGRMWNDTVIEAIRRLDTDHIDLSEKGLDVYQTTSVADKFNAIAKILDKLKYMDTELRQEHADHIGSLVSDLPNDLMMTNQQVRHLHSAGMDVGGHTVSHPILANLSDRDSLREISDGKAQLEEIIGGPVQLFAYPNGKYGKDYKEKDVAQVKHAGFKAAVSTNWGVSGDKSDLFHLPRFTPWDKTPGKFALRMAQNYLKLV